MNNDSRPKCPGQDMRYWLPEDIFTLKCPHCGNEIEFWKDEPFLNCRKCGKEARNPRINLGCAKWCKHAAECLGNHPELLDPASPVIERVKAILSQDFKDCGKKFEQMNKLLLDADSAMSGRKCDPCVIKTALCLLVFMQVSDCSSGKIQAILEKSEFPKELRDDTGKIVDAILKGGSIDSVEYEIVRHCF